MRQNLIKMRTMSILIRSVIMIVLFAGFQGMAVDVTCMVLWNAEPLELSQDDLSNHFTHHPNAPESHQASSEADASLTDFGSMLDQLDIVAPTTLLHKPQVSGVPFSHTQLKHLNVQILSDTTPPKATTIA